MIGPIDAASRHADDQAQAARDRTAELARAARHVQTYEQYARWSVAPVMTREQWEADQRLLHADFPAWRKLHRI
jgi:hypothetical protein